MTNTAAASAGGPEAGKCNLGVLFVHGIGAQQRGATLSAFGGTLYTWLAERFAGHDLKWHDALSDQPELIEWWLHLENWATDGFVGTPPEPPSLSGGEMFDVIRKIGKEKKWDTLVGRAVLVDSRVADPGDVEAPAHAVLQINRLTVDGQLCHERWLLAESWWAETFSAPTFREFARWGRRTIPWTVGSHFGTHLRRAFAQRPDETSPAAGWRRVVRSCGRLLRVVGAVLALVAGVLVSPLVLAAFGLLLMLALVPIPQLREWVLRIQLQVAATLGDSYILLVRPIEAAAIVAQVRRDLDWLVGKCCGVAIVAHSQGGAVAHLALQRGVPNHLRLLFTFGSGLKKLEQLRYLLESGDSLRRSSILTIIALPLCAVGLAWFVLLPLAYSERHNTQLWRGIPMMLSWTVVFGLIAFAGLRDYVKPIVPNGLRRWLARLRELPFAWVDSYATADPVSNGGLKEEDIAGHCSKEVCNMSSMRSDHTSYWANRDEFVTFLFTKLADAPLRRDLGLPPATELVSDDAELEYLAKRRRWRVGLWTAIGWIGAAAVLVSVARAWPAWYEFLSYWGRRFVGWAASLAGIDTPPPQPVRLHWGAVGYLALAVVPLWIARTIWRRQNEAEMRQIVERHYAGLETPIGVLVAIWFQVMFAVGVAEGGAPGFLEVLGTMLAVWVPILLVAPRPLSEEPTPNRAMASELDQSRAERITMYILTKGMMLGPAFGFGIAAWWVVCWVTRALLGGTIFGFDPKQVSAGWIGLGFVAAWGCIIVVVSARRRKSAVRPGHK
jgi:hypothetical protein